MTRACLTAVRVAALFSFCLLAFAFQLSSADSPVEIVPRAKAPSKIAQLDPVLRVDSSLVLIPARVTTLLGASVTSLCKENFQLFEDGVEQKISDFIKDDAPVSVGLLLDASGSMHNKMEKSAEAAAAFFRTANTEDEFFLLKFGDRAKLTVPFTPNPMQLYNAIVHTRPFGRTSLFDAIHMAVEQMKQARNPRKAIVILSDGGDNWSHHTIRSVKNAVAESDVQVYAMGIFDPDYYVKHPAEERRGPELLDQLAEQSGGRHFPVSDIDGLPTVSARIGRELRDEYLLGYYSSNKARDGKYRQVKLNLTAPDAGPRLQTYYRRGYYAPAQ